MDFQPIRQGLERSVFRSFFYTPFLSFRDAVSRPRIRQKSQQRGPVKNMLVNNYISSYIVSNIEPRSRVIAMIEDAAATGFSALGNRSRLRIFRLLVQAGRDGVPISYIRGHLGIPLSTLAHHLGTLVRADLVSQSKSGREVICRASFDRMDSLVAYLTLNCCAGLTQPDAIAQAAAKQDREPSHA